MRNKSFTLTVMALFVMTAFFPTSTVNASEAYIPQVSIDKQVDKTEAMPGDEITYTLNATNTSTAYNTPLDVMLVIDRSGSMGSASGCSNPIYLNQTTCENNSATWDSTSKMESAKTAAKYFVDQLNPSNDMSGVVAFSSSASLLQGLTYNQTSVKSQIDTLVASGGTRIDYGIDSAYAEFVANSRPFTADQVMIVLSDGKSTGDPAASALIAKNNGVRVISIGLGSGVNESQMKDIASSNSDYYFAPTSNELTTIYNSILGTLCHYKDLTINDDITDVLVGADLISSTPVATQVDNELTWEFSNVGCNETVTASFTVKVKDDATHGLVLPNMAKVIEDHEISVDSEEVTTTIYNLDPAVLTIEKDVDTTKAAPGDTLNYTILVTNIGEESATDVVVDDVLPEGLVYQDGTTEKQWLFDIILPGESETIKYVAIVDNDATTNDYVNVASVSAAGLAAVEDDATTAVEVPVVLGEEALPSLTVDKTANVDFTNPGGTVTYTVVVTNNGDAIAEDAVLIDHIATGMQYTDTVAPTHTWMLGDITPGDSITTSYDAVVSVEAEDGIYTNTAEVWAAGLENIYDTANVEVRSVAVLGAEDLPVTGGGYLMIFIYMIGAGFIAMVAKNIYKLTTIKK